MQNYKLERDVKNRAKWERAIKKANVRPGLYWKKQKKNKKEKKEKEKENEGGEGEE